MTSEGETNRVTPGVDLLAGGFFLCWAGAGWWSYLGHDRLRQSFFASVDPGPALLPLITLWLLTGGGALIAVQGLWRVAMGRWDGIALPALRSHCVPAAFAASMLIAVLSMRALGFVTVSFAFCLIWITVLSAPGRVGLRDHSIGIALAAIYAAAITWSLHAVFVQLLLVQLPR